MLYPHLLLSLEPIVQVVAIPAASSQPKLMRADPYMFRDPRLFIRR